MSASSVLSQVILRKLVVTIGGYSVLGVIIEIARRNLARRRALKLMLRTVKCPWKSLHWFWGILPALKQNAQRRLEFTEDLFAECGKPKTVLLPAACVLGPRQAGHQLCTADPANIKWIFKDNYDNYIKTPEEPPFFYDLFGEFIGSGIFLIDHGPHARSPADKGHKWTQQRKTAATIFSQSKFQTFYQDVFTKHGRELVHLLQESGGAPIDIQDLFFKYTLDSFGVMAFDVDFKTMTPKPDPFGAAFDNSHRLIFKIFFESALVLNCISLLPPGCRQLSNFLFQRWSARYQEFRQHLRTVRTRVSQIIQQRRSDPELAKKKDLLALFMNSADEQGRQKYLQPSDGHDRELADMILNFMIAGRDTTAGTLSWTMYELARPENHAVRAKLVAEIDCVLGSKEPTYADVKDRLPYLRGVIYEVLRLHPNVPNIILTSVSDDVWPDGTACAAGTVVRIFAYGTCRSQELYEDPLVLRPERWIPFKQPSQWDYPVFKGGPRLCLGMAMALFEASLLMAMLLQRFRPELHPGQDPIYSQMVTMSVHNRATDKAELLVSFHQR
mmetsp:Transcript_30659/g.60156  ORF Transcript_30659/g.60156 Transcript_30659/m.60156 type:complete len:557 (-) Transcript_30659:24-1694(-)